MGAGHWPSRRWAHHHQCVPYKVLRLPSFHSYLCVACGATLYCSAPCARCSLRRSRPGRGLHDRQRCCTMQSLPHTQMLIGGSAVLSGHVQAFLRWCRSLNNHSQFCYPAPFEVTPRATRAGLNCGRIINLPLRIFGLAFRTFLLRATALAHLCVSLVSCRPELRTHDHGAVLLRFDAWHDLLRAAVAAEALCGARFHDHRNRAWVPAQLWRLLRDARRHRPELIRLEPGHRVSRCPLFWIIRLRACMDHHHRGKAEVLRTLFLLVVRCTRSKTYIAQGLGRSGKTKE